MNPAAANTMASVNPVVGRSWKTCWLHITIRAKLVVKPTPNRAADPRAATTEPGTTSSMSVDPPTRTSVTASGPRRPHRLAIPPPKTPTAAPATPRAAHIAGPIQLARPPSCAVSGAYAK